MLSRKRLGEVYWALGAVLNNPRAFGLGDRAPEALVDVLTGARRKLLQELAADASWGEEDRLEAELSQDSDTLLLHL
jgi:hypothetical protein